jgi:hypothetical protein
VCYVKSIKVLTEQGVCWKWKRCDRPERGWFLMRESERVRPFVSLVSILGPNEQGVDPMQQQRARGSVRSFHFEWCAGRNSRGISALIHQCLIILRPDPDQGSNTSLSLVGSTKHYPPSRIYAERTLIHCIESRIWKLTLLCLSESMHLTFRQKRCL